jgi:hypothetical protein
MVRNNKYSVYNTDEESVVHELCVVQLTVTSPAVYDQVYIDNF